MEQARKKRKEKGKRWGGGGEAGYRKEWRIMEWERKKREKKKTRKGGE